MLTDNVQRSIKNVFITIILIQYNGVEFSQSPIASLVGVNLQEATSSFLEVNPTKLEIEE